MNRFENFRDDARIWIYQSNRFLTDEESPSIQQEIDLFANGWVAHNHELKATGKIMRGYFVILSVDESYHKPSGCSIDSSVHFIQSMEKKFGISFFERLNLAYETGEGIELIHKSNIRKNVESGHLTNSTMIFNNLIQSNEELDSKWRIPLSESWAATLIPAPL